MSSYSASQATRRGSIVPPLTGVDSPVPDHVPDECDVLICGTGMAESVLAAALAWQGSNVLHVDKHAYYGDSSAVLNIDQLKDWVSEVNESDKSVFSDAMLYIPRPITNKEYLIDLCPKIMFARSDLLELLIKSRVSRYLEFKPIGSFHTYEQDTFEKVAGSKGDIFSDQSLSLVTKRTLMKFIKFVLQWEQQHSVWESYTKEPICKFMENEFQLESAQITELVVTLGLCKNIYVSTPEALSRIKRYVCSFDVYGAFPALYSMYGSGGEISQGFCRSAAVGGATYKLNTELKSFSSDNKVATFNDGSRIRVKEKVVVSPSNSLDKVQAEKQVTRMVAIVAKSCQEWFAENECTAVVVFPPGTLKDNQNAVQVIIYGYGSGQVPQDQAIWYLSTAEEDTYKARKDLEEALGKLEENILRESTEGFMINADPSEMSYRDGMPIVSSVRLGQSMQQFVPKEKLQFLLKLQYTQKLGASPNNTDTTIYSQRPSREISFDGVVSEARLLYEKITGADDDFFDVDFEDEEEQVVDETGMDHGDHAADEMEL